MGLEVLDEEYHPIWVGLACASSLSAQAGRAPHALDTHEQVAHVTAFLLDALVLGTQNPRINRSICKRRYAKCTNHAKPALSQPAPGRHGPPG